MNRRTDLTTQLAVVAIVLFFPHIAPLPFYSYTLVCAVAIHVELRRHGKRFRDLGLHRVGLTCANTVIGIGSGLVWAAFMKFVYIPLAKAATSGVRAYDEYDFIRRHPVNLAIALAGAWLVGGLYEEMAFRGYVNRVFYSLSRGLSAARWLGLFLVSLLFGLYHWQQGILGILAAALGGIYWSCLIRWRGGNLWPAVFSHATYDTTALLLIYWGRF